MASKKRAVALAAAKQKKQKVIAIGGVVLLLGVMVYSVPKTLKMLKGPQPIATATPATTPTPPPVVPGATPATPTAEVATSDLIDTGAQPEPTEGQFISFERFASKDPFAQQVEPAAAAPGAAPPEGAQPEVPGPGEAPAPGSPSTPSAPIEPTTPTAPAPAETAPAETAPAEKPTSAVVSINGIRETVLVGANFPKEDEIFQLVSLTATSAKIGIAGGSLTGGAPTVTLEKGKKVTLMNTADGTQYELVLVSLG